MAYYDYDDDTCYWSEDDSDNDNGNGLVSPEAKTEEVEPITDDEKVAWVRKYYDLDWEDATEAYDTYWNYRSEGQTHQVSLQYAGLC